MDIQVIGNNATVAKWAAAIVIFTTTYCKVQFWLNKISKIVGPLIADAEQMAKDGLIDKADRKKAVLNVIVRLEADGTLKLNFITRHIVFKIVDVIAGKLPDFKISQNARELLTKS